MEGGLKVEQLDGDVMPRESTIKDFEKEETIQGSFYMSSAMYERLRLEAFQTHKTMATIIREGLDLYFTQKEKPVEPVESVASSESTRWKDVLGLLKDCRKANALSSFELDGNSGFFNQAVERELCGDAVWSENALKMAFKDINKGWNGYASKPDQDGFLGKFDVLGLSEKRMKLVEGFVEYLYAEVDEEDEGTPKTKRSKKSDDDDW